MKNKLIQTHNFFTSRAEAIPREKLGYLLLGLIFLSLVLYLSAIIFTVDESFKKDHLLKDLKLVRQDLQAKEELFTLALSDFYGNNAASFVATVEKNQQFVSRRENVAQAPG